MLVEGLVNGSTYSDTVPMDDNVSTGLCDEDFDRFFLHRLKQQAQTMIVVVIEIEMITVTRQVTPDRNILKCIRVGKSIKKTCTFKNNNSKHETHSLHKRIPLLLTGVGWLFPVAYVLTVIVVIGIFCVVNDKEAENTILP